MSRPRAIALAILLPTLALGAACPAEVDPALAKPAPAPAPAVGEEDPRVIRDGEDLYAAQTIERAEELQRDAAGEPTNLGSGRSDESNGVCRLYAPRLPKPECCNAEFGFDVESVKATCGLDTYLGESFQGSCGYYFHKPDEDPVRSYFRMSFVAGASPKDAAETHDRKVQERNPSVTSTPIPGIEGAYWSGMEGVSWAFLPGWDKVRQLTWRESMCSRDTIIPLIQQIVAAPQPPKGAQRLGLVPKARKPAATAAG
jgi:hypothetical protein